MADEDIATVETEVVDAEIVEEKPIAETPDEVVEEAEDGDDLTDLLTEEEAPDTLDFNFGGNAFSVPKDAVPEELAGKIQEFVDGNWSAVTKKNQEIAETRKSLEAQAKALENLHNLEGEALASYSRGEALKNQLRELQSINLNEMWQSDPDRARQISDLTSSVSQQLEAAIAETNAKEQEALKAQETEFSRRRTEGRETLDRKIKGFSTEIAPKLVDYVVETYGMDRQSAELWDLNPISAEMAFKAYQWDELQRKAAARKKPSQAAPVQPVSKGRNARATVDPDKMSTDQWLKWRNAQLAKR